MVTLNRPGEEWAGNDEKSWKEADRHDALLMP